MFASISKPKAYIQDPFAALNRRFGDVVRLCGEVRFTDMTIRPELFHIIAPGAGETVIPHRHPFTELTWVEGATIEYRHNDERIRVHDGELFFMPVLTGHLWHTPMAGDCGFKDPTYFCRAFRRQVGLTPAVYARSVR